MPEMNATAGVSNAGSIYTQSIADTHETPAKYPGLLVHDISEAQEDTTIKGHAPGSSKAMFVSIPWSATYTKGGLKPGATYRLKEAPSDFHAAIEVLSGNIFKLSGLKCPAMHLVNNCRQMQEGSAIFDPDKLYIASEYVPSLKLVDIGDYPFTPQGKQVILAEHPHLEDAYNQEIQNHKVWWSSNFGHNNRFFFCHFSLVGDGRQISQY
ncbi:hypothetical protein ACVBEF_12570 [Glaciimonas sp. GG7]